MHKGRRLDMESFTEQMETRMRGNLVKTLSTEMECISFVMGSNSLENIEKIKWRGKGSLYELMGRDTRENMLMAKSKVLESLIGRMAGAMKVCDSMGSSTGKEFISLLKESVEKASGRKERGSIGIYEY